MQEEAGNEFPIPVLDPAKLVLANSQLWCLQVEGRGLREALTAVRALGRLLAVDTRTQLMELRAAESRTCENRRRDISFQSFPCVCPLS